MNTRNAVALLLFITALPMVSRADIPRTIAFQGVLTNASGVPEPDAYYNVTFKLYDALSGGNLLWTETNKAVVVAGGHGQFSASLGTPTPFGALAFNAPYFVDIQVQGEVASMTPRLPLQAVPYALSAGAANLTLPFTGSVPTAGAALSISNIGTGLAISGTSVGGPALYGASAAANGVIGYSQGAGQAGVAGVSNGASAGNGLYGRSDNGGSGVYGTSTADGVYGESTNGGFGVYGTSAGTGVVGRSTTNGYGVYGTSADTGVAGISSGNGAGIWGQSDAGIGVNAVSNTNTALAAVSQTAIAVFGRSGTGIGTYGESNGYDGVVGITHANGHAGVSGLTTANGYGIYGRSDGGGYAGWFDGTVHVGVLEIAGGADVAERFRVNGATVPGTVVSIDPDHPGCLRIAQRAYDHCVAGVISGANHLKAGMVLSGGANTADTHPVAMTGRVWVKCDTARRAIAPGDLLTTDSRPGYAMAVGDHNRAVGATLGKAMTSLKKGRTGMVLALVNMQ